jgi:putative hemolysin
MATPAEAVTFAEQNRGTPKLSVALARTPDEIKACQRLRYKIFAQELGATLDSDQDEDSQGLDIDAYDKDSKHLLVRDTRSGAIVGTTRLISASHLHEQVAFYSQSEFDINNVLRLPGRFMEVGRTCIHTDYRNGSTIAVLWQGLARMMVVHDVDYLIGCASIPLDDGGASAAAIMQRIREKHLAAPELRVQPLKALPPASTRAIGNPSVPSLLKAYLRLGAHVCGEPYWDEKFNVADVFILLDRNRLAGRYAKHFVQHG